MVSALLRGFGFSATRASRRRYAKAATKAILEHLEPRQLLSASATYFNAPTEVPSGWTTSVYAQGRIGRIGTATFEGDIGRTSSTPIQSLNFPTGQDWISGQSKAFSLTVDNAGKATWRIAGATRMSPSTPAGQTVPDFVEYTGTFIGTDLRLYAKTAADTQVVTLSNLALTDSQNQTIISGLTLSTNGTIANYQALWLADPALSSGFTLTGNATFTWAGTRPTNSNMHFQVTTGNWNNLTSVTSLAPNNVASEYRNGSILPASFTVERTGGTTTSQTIDLALSGTATWGNKANLTGDYYLAYNQDGSGETITVTKDPITVTNGKAQVSIQAGSASTTIYIIPNDADEAGEPDEQIIVTLEKASAGPIDPNSKTASISLFDKPTISVAATKPYSIEGLTTGQFTFTRTGDPYGEVTATYTISGTATEDPAPPETTLNDYAYLNRSITFTTNGTQTLTVTPHADSHVEGIETVTLTLDQSEFPQELPYQLVTGSGLTATIQISDLYVDLDVDSDNNNTSLPDRSSQEDASEDDTELPGKLIWSNNGDTDGDGVPDFADGYDFEYQGLSQWGDGASGKLVPLVFQVPKGFTGKVRFTYASSDPNAVTHTINPDETVNWQPANGSLRIWTRDGAFGRSIEDNFVADGASYDLGRFGEFSANSGIHTVYAELVRPSEAVGDVSVLLELVDTQGTALTSDTVLLTGMQWDLVELKADGTTSGPVTSLVTSHPTPEVTIESYEFQNLRVSADGSTILADLHIAGTLDSNFGDITPDVVNVDYVRVFVNGVGLDSDSVSVTTTKTPTNNIIRPYDYSGTFSGTIVGVAVQPGANKIEVVAEDNITKFTGFAGANIEVNASAPAPYYTLNFVIGSGTSSAPQFVIISFEHEGQPTSVQLEHAVNGPVYIGEFLGEEVSLTIIDGEALDQNLQDSEADIIWRATVTGLPVIGDVIRLEKTNADVSNTDYKQNRETYSDYTITQGASGLTQRSEGGELRPYLTRVSGPAAIASTMSLQTSSGYSIPVINWQDSYYVSSMSSQDLGLPAISVMLGSTPPTTPTIGYIVKESAKQAGGFFVGYNVGINVGFVQGIWGLVEGTYSLASWIIKADSDQLATTAVWLWHLGDAPFFSESAKDLGNGISDTAQVLWKISKEIAETQEAFRYALLGDYTELNKKSGTLRTVYEIAAPLIARIMTEWASQSGYDAGYQAGQIVGRILFEVAAIILPFTKAGHITKIAVLQKLNELSKSGKVFKAGSAADIALTNAIRSTGIGQDGSVAVGSLAKIMKLTDEYGEITKIETGADLNRAARLRGWQPPYVETELTYTVRTTKIITVKRSWSHIADRWPQGSFTAPADEVAGLSGERLKDLLALPTEPTKIMTVEIPEGTLVRVSRAGSNTYGQGGRVQVEILDKWAAEWFKLDDAILIPANGI